MDDFYIGWQDEASASAKRFKRQVWIVILVLMIITAFLLGSKQGPFSNSIFEFGKQTEVTGVLELWPVPSLVVENTEQPSGTERILLVSFGKAGAQPLISQIEEQAGHSLEGHYVTLRGTQIYFDNRRLLELTDQEEAFIEIGESAGISHTLRSGKRLTLAGEILDSKCYFGVMKPGEGKPHKSCAARCLSGGIPAVYRTIDQDGNNSYYILLDAEGHPANQLLLPFAGDAIAVCGQAYKYEDWNLLYLDTTAPIQRMGPAGIPPPVLCSTNGR